MLITLFLDLLPPVRSIWSSHCFEIFLDNNLVLRRGWSPKICLFTNSFPCSKFFQNINNKMFALPSIWTMQNILMILVVVFYICLHSRYWWHEIHLVWGPSLAQRLLLLCLLPHYPCWTWFYHRWCRHHLPRMREAEAELNSVTSTTNSLDWHIGSIMTSKFLARFHFKLSSGEWIVNVTSLVAIV